MKPLPWFRYYPEAALDPRLEAAAAALHLPRPHLLGLWTLILCLAARSPVRGALYLAPEAPYSLEDLAAVLRMRPKRLAALVEHLERVGLLARLEDGAMAAIEWDAQQFTPDVSTERVRRLRQRRREAAGNVSSPQAETQATPPDTETELIVGGGGAAAGGSSGGVRGETAPAPQPGEGRMDAAMPGPAATGSAAGSGGGFSASPRRGEAGVRGEPGPAHAPGHALAPDPPAQTGHPPTGKAGMIAGASGGARGETGFSAADAERIYRSVTGFVAFPAASKADDIERITRLAAIQGAAIVDYLRPFFQAWAVERGYDPANTRWLDWAVVGKAPPRRLPPGGEAAQRDRAHASRPAARRGEVGAARGGRGIERITASIRPPAEEMPF